MDFSWSEAGRIALIGFVGVFIILFILELSLGLTSAIVRRFGTKLTEKEKTKKQ